MQLVKVTPAPLFKSTEYSGYNTWSHKFRAWAQLQGLWSYYEQEVPAPIPTGFTHAELAAYMGALQVH